MPAPSTGRRVASAVVIAVLAVVVVTLSVMALSSARAPHGAATPAPTSTFTPSPSTTPTETTTPTPTVAPVSRADERFLSYAGSSVWRAVAGACGGDAPVLERLDAQGSWIDAASNEFTVRQIASLDAYGDGAVVVGGADDGCEAASLRTFSNGAEWTTYDGAVEQARFVSLTDPAIVHTRAGDVAAPCTEATGLRAAGDVVALICDAQVWQQTDASWTALPIPDARAVGIDDADLIVAHVTDECSGLALTRVSGTTNTSIGCVEDIDAGQPVAVAATGNGVAIWAGDSILEVAG